MVRIKVIYHGSCAAEAGVDSDELEISSDIKVAYEFLIRHLTNDKGFKPPFLLLVRDQNITGAIKKNIKLIDGDVFHVIPHISGG